jgi:hypothetical protein
LNVPARKKSGVLWFALGKIDPVEFLRQRPVSAGTPHTVGAPSLCTTPSHVLRRVSNGKCKAATCAPQRPGSGQVWPRFGVFWPQALSFQIEPAQDGARFQTRCRAPR